MKDPRGGRPAWLDAGVRRRMKYEEGRISSQHDQLNSLFAAVIAALDRSTVHIARQAFTRFADALEAHFSLEDDLYFPALHGMREDLGGQLQVLAAEHRDLRDRLAALRALLGAGEAVTSRERLLELAEILVDHEDREEILISEINGTVPPMSQ